MPITFTSDIICSVNTFNICFYKSTVFLRIQGKLDCIKFIPETVFLVKTTTKPFSKKNCIIKKEFNHDIIIE